MRIERRAYSVPPFEGMTEETSLPSGSFMMPLNRRDKRGTRHVILSGFALRARTTWNGC